MEAPKCKLCGVKHLLSEPHAFSKEDAELGRRKAMPIAAEINHTWETRKHCKTCRCFPMTAAERQKAYRERHKAK